MECGDDRMLKRHSEEGLETMIRGDQELVKKKARSVCPFPLTILDQAIERLNTILRIQPDRNVLLNEHKKNVDKKSLIFIQSACFVSGEVKVRCIETEYLLEERVICGTRY
jgi:hypothetical protein